MSGIDYGQEQSTPTAPSGLPEKWGEGILQPRVSPRHIALPGPQAEEIGEMLKELSGKPKKQPVKF